MRRRWSIDAPFQMVKGNGKNHRSRICFLSSLCFLFWGLLFYVYFIVLGGNSVSIPATLQTNPIRIETFDPISSSEPLFENERPNVISPIEVNSSSDPPSVLSPVEDKLNGGVLSPVEDKLNDGVLSPDGDKLNGGVLTPDEDKLNGDVLTPDEVKLSEDGFVEKGVDVPSPKDDLIPKEEPRELLFMKALRTADNKSDPCGGRYIYVHDLPSKFNDDMLKECKSLSLWTNMCKFTTNAGLGPPLENVEGVFSNTGWYATNQFAVDVVFNNRMKQYECLTNDSSLAAAIFVPFYAGFDIARYLWGYNISMRDAASLQLTDWLMKRPEWKIMDGRDHFLVAGRITWDFRRLSEDENDWGSKLLFLPAAKNMSMLVVESSPWNANDFAIPYPTYFHPAHDAEVFAWQDRMRNLRRRYLYSFAGAPRPDNPKSIRGQIIDECKLTKSCKLLECDFGESKCHSPDSIMKMFQSSVFCLQPQGDSYTRRSAFDSMLAGCIPVFFHPGSAYAQYTWHLPKNFSTYSVFIPETMVRMQNLSIAKTLQEIPLEQVKIMRETVINLIPQLVYADPRSKLETLRDAFDTSVQAIIDKVTRLRKNIIEGRTEYDYFIEENSWKYALLDEGQREARPHEWDPFFSKPKPGEPDFS